MVDVDSYKPAWVEVDLDAIAHNLALVRKITRPGTKVLGVVKADAYGHGAVPVAKRLIERGVDYLAVASLEEAVELRDAGINCPILVLGILHPTQVGDALDLNLTLTLFTKTMARALGEEARRRNTRARVHVKVDTGMGRLGVWFEDARAFIEEVASNENIEVEGVFTHLSSADEDEKYTLEQISHFNNLLGALGESKLRIPYRHAANSMGLLGYKAAHFNMVRPGLMLYGLYPDNKAQRPYKLAPAMSFYARVVWLKDTPAGRAISYSRTYVTKSATKIASLPVGYSHGYPRALSNKAHVLIAGSRAPVVGRICMDQTMVDVGRLSNGVKLGDKVCLLGEEQGGKIKAEELAEICGTISYEIVCWISKRIPRIYIN